MLRLTDQQREQAAAFIGDAEAMACRYRVDKDIAYIAMCEAVARYKPGRKTLKQFVTYALFCVCKRESARNYKRRNVVRVGLPEYI